MDLEARQRLIEWIDKIGHSYQTETAIPLDMYFTGNDEECCIITCNTGEHISSNYLYTQLAEVRNRQEVNDVLVRFYDYDDALQDDDIWINADTVWVVTCASVADVSKWVDHLCPSDIHEEEIGTNFVNPPEIPAGYPKFDTLGHKNTDKSIR
jgi:hypothetical protein